MLTVAIDFYSKYGEKNGTKQLTVAIDFHTMEKKNGTNSWR